MRTALLAALRIGLEECDKRIGIGNGNGRSNTALTTLKMAVLAPIPSASAIVATMLTLGDLSSMRSPNRMSCSSVFIVNP
jgi:hypothetical protein